MSKPQYLPVLSAALSLSIAGLAQAAPHVATGQPLDHHATHPMGQVNSVFQLRDVSPSDWAFDALRNLVEKYNCIVGYPNASYHGDRPLSRYEFAAGLNACMQQIERLIVEGDGDVDPADLARLRNLVEEFEAELVTLGARVDDLEGRVNFLEDHQFSTTTTLKGEVIFALSDSFGDTNLGDAIGAADAGLPIPELKDSTAATFADRVRLTLETSFTGQDKLVTRLAAGNAASLSPDAYTNGDFVILGTAAQTFNLLDTGNDVGVDWLAYYFPVGKADVYVAATGGIHSDYVPDTFNPYFEDFDGGNGALSVFAAESPIYRIGGGAGAGLTLPLGRKTDFTVGYLAQDAAWSSEDDGIFNGAYAALAQVGFDFDRLKFGLTYVNSYQDGDGAIYDSGLGDSVVGTEWANYESYYAGTGLVETNSFGMQAAFKLNDKISLSGFGMYTDADVIGGTNYEIWSYGLGIALPDFGKTGNVLGIFAGAPPYLGDSDLEVPLHVEGFYKHQINDHISITPGVIWVSYPAQGAFDEAGTLIGTLRTTFKF